VKSPGPYQIPLSTNIHRDFGGVTTPRRILRENEGAVACSPPEHILILEATACAITQALFAEILFLKKMIFFLEKNLAKKFEE
jgi:hypothetical protein